MAGRRGAISIWYVIVLSGLVVLFGMSTLLLRQEKIDNQLKRQSRMLAHNSLMTYDTSLFKSYGILATTEEAAQEQVEADVEWLLRHQGIDGWTAPDQMTYSVCLEEDLLTLEQTSQQMIEAARMQVGEEAIKLARERLQAWDKGEKSAALLKTLRKGYAALAAVEEWDRKVGKTIHALSKAELEIRYYTNRNGKLVIYDNLDDHLEACEDLLAQLGEGKEILRPVRTFAQGFETDVEAVWDQLLPEVQDEATNQLSTFKAAGHIIPLEEWTENVQHWKAEVQALEDTVDALRSYDGAKSRLKKKVRRVADQAEDLTLDVSYDLRAPDQKAERKAKQWMAVAPEQFEETDQDKLSKAVIRSLPSNGARQALEGSLTDSLLLTEYIVGTFRHARSHRDDRNGGLDWDFFGKMERSSTFPNEMEYIAVGGNPNTAYMRMQAEIYGIRSASNLIHVYTCKEKKTAAAAIGALAAWTGIGSPIITNGVLVGWALAESGMDMDALHKGEGVPLYKWKDDQWRLDIDVKPEEQVSGQGREQGAEDPLEWHYVDYIRLHLQLVSMERRVARSLDVIWVNMDQPDLRTYMGKVQVELAMAGPAGKQLKAESELRYVAE